jgi:hypothetical protein
VAEGFELGDEAAGFPFGVQAGGEVVGAEFVVGLSGGQDVPDDDDQGCGGPRRWLSSWRPGCGSRPISSRAGGRAI